jgi:hypothetical protein
VSQGGVLLGPAPERSPSLEDYGHADQEVRRLAGELWGADAVKTHAVGKGIVMNGCSMEEALDLLKLPPDCGTAVSDSLLFIHRATPFGEDIFFVSNQSAGKVSVEPAFRIQGKVPVLFDPLMGTERDLPAYTQQDEVTRVPLQLEGYQSFFVVFRRDGNAVKRLAGGVSNFPAPEKTVEIVRPWTVYFDTASRGPAKPVGFPRLTDWAEDARDSIRNYSGRAVYRNTFSWGKVARGARLYLDLGKVRAMAKVKVNGVYAGGAWTPPYVVDITRAVRTGANVIEIEVVNTWVNRLIGDSRLPADERKTWSNVNPYQPESNHVPSGLLGPVKILAYKQ